MQAIALSPWFVHPQQGDHKGEPGVVNRPSAITFPRTGEPTVRLAARRLLPLLLGMQVSAEEKGPPA